MRVTSGLGAAGNLPAAFLYPGTMHCAPQPSVVTTVLGSCVAVCLTDRRRRVSGLNLPAAAWRHRQGGPAPRRHPQTLCCSTRCCGSAAGSRTSRRRFFGGAAVLPVGKPAEAVGSKNVAVALACLRALDIEVVARRTGGKSGMLVRLFTATGEVLVRRVSSAVEWRSDTLLATGQGPLLA